MKSVILATALIALVWAVGCAKKDDGGGAAGPACPATTVNSSLGCIAQAQCPIGLGQSPSEPSMCVDLRTGQNVQTQQCGAGFFLTVSGCFPQGTCQQGQAQVGNNCNAVVSGSSTNWTAQQQPQTGFQYNPYGGTTAYPGYGGYNPYQSGFQYNPYAGYGFR